MRIEKERLKKFLLYMYDLPFLCVFSKSSYKIKTTNLKRRTVFRVKVIIVIL